MAAKSGTLPHLLDVVKARYPESVGPERWYLVAVSHVEPSHLPLSPFPLSQLRTVIFTVFLFQPFGTTNVNEVLGIGSHNQLRPF